MRKIQQQEDIDVLGKGQGVAFVATPSSGILKPWSAVVVRVVAFNNMPGNC